MSRKSIAATLALLSVLAMGAGEYCGATRVAMLGDSITNSNGLAEGQKLPDRLKLAMGALWMVDQYGIPGDSATSCNTRWNSDLHPPRTTGLLPQYSYIVVLCGINDINLGGADAATVWGRIKTISDNIVADGVSKPVLLTLLPFGNSSGWSAGKQTELEGTNTLMLAHCAANPGVVICVNSYAAMGDTDPVDLKAAWDIGDGVHPNLAGTDALAAAIKAVLVTSP